MRSSKELLGSNVTTDHATMHAVVAGDLDRYKLFGHTLKFEIFSENRKTDARGDEKVLIQFASPKV